MFQIRDAVGKTPVSLAFRGSLTMRAGLALGSTVHSPSNGDLLTGTGGILRRGRFGVEGTISPFVKTNFLVDFHDGFTPTESKTPLALADADFELILTKLRLGLSRVPFTRHAQVDETRQVFLEAPTGWRADRLLLGRGPLTAMLPDRRPGVSLHDELDVFDYAIGFYSGGGPGSQESTASGIFTGRLEVAPWGPPPREGAYFPADEEYGEARVAFGVGGLSRSGPSGSTRAVSGAVTASYRGFFASVEAAVGEGSPRGIDVNVGQRAFTADLAWRFPWAFHGVELGARFDAWKVDRMFDRAADQKSLSVVANVYLWRHRIKVGTLFRSLVDDADVTGRQVRNEGLADMTVGF
ncbi:MAG: hypothetical protein U0169_15155 [Polyangiaceae bacterium]